MGSMMSSIRDDEDDWNDFRRKTDAPSNWDVYSREAQFAKMLHDAEGYVGRELRLLVRHRIEQDDLAIKQASEWKEFQQLETLRKKYE